MTRTRSVHYARPSAAGIAPAPQIASLSLGGLVISRLSQPRDARQQRRKERHISREGIAGARAGDHGIIQRRLPLHGLEDHVMPALATAPC